MMQTRDQRYAASAFAQIERASENWSEAERKKYGAMAHKLPVLLRTAGLAQALGFVESRGDAMQHLLLDHLAATIDVGTGSQLVQRSRSAELGEYMLLTRRMQDALLWYKRFAQSVLGVEPGADTEDGTESDK